MQGLYDTTKFWLEHEIVSINPFYLTPYIDTVIYYENKEKILKQWNNDEEAFVSACGDAVDFVVNLTDKFTDAELRGLRTLMQDMDLEGLRIHSDWRIKMGLDSEEERIKDPDPKPGRRGYEEVN